MSVMFTKLWRKRIVARIAESFTNRQRRYSRTLIITTVHLWSLRVKFVESASRPLLLEGRTCLHTLKTDHLNALNAKKDLNRLCI